MKVVRTAVADRDINRLREWLSKISPGYATEVLSQVRARIRRLREFPEMGQVVISATNVRHLIVGHVRVFYRVSNEQIVILRVRDARQALLEPDQVGEKPAVYRLEIRASGQSARSAGRTSPGKIR